MRFGRQQTQLHDNAAAIIDDTPLRDGERAFAVDVLADSPVQPLLRAAGFHQVGESVLMRCGEAGKVRFDEVVALASLGSMG